MSWLTYLYNTKEEIDQLSQGLELIQGNFIPVLLDQVLGVIPDQVQHVLTEKEEERLTRTVLKAYRRKEKQDQKLFRQETKRFTRLWKEAENEEKRKKKREEKAWRKQYRTGICEALRQIHPKESWQKESDRRAREQVQETLVVEREHPNKYWIHTIHNTRGWKTIEKFLTLIRSIVLGQSLQLHVKVVYTLGVNLVNISLDDKKRVKREEKKVYFSKSPYHLVYEQDKLDSYDVLIEHFNSKLAEIELQKSGWVLESILNLSIKMTRFHPLRGGCRSITLPQALRRSVLNLENSGDNACFKWAVSFLVFPQDRPRITKQLRLLADHHFDWTHINFPSGTKDFITFEKKNPTYLIYIYLLEKKEFSIFYKSFTFHEDQKTKTILNLLLYKDHFYPIKNLTAFHKYVFQTKHSYLVCQSCLNHYSSQRLLDEHYVYCQHVYPHRVKYPSSGKTTYFQKFRATLKSPLVVYLDIESNLEKIEQSCGNYTHRYRKHQACHFGLLLVEQQRSHYYHFDTAKEVIQFLDYVSQLLEKNVPLREKKKARQALKYKRDTQGLCDFCQLSEKEDDSFVQHHCHYSGRFLGIFHNSCNLKCQKRKVLPVFSHNMAGYDEKHLIRSVLSPKTHIIAKNVENFIALEYKNLYGIRVCFLDSFKFLQSSLSSLVDNLRREKDEEQLFSHTFKHLGKNYENWKTLFLRKGVYPYDYMSDETKLSETQLPPHSEFFNQLSQKNISKDEYQFAQQFWKETNCQTMKDYMQLYLKLDVCLLADVFEAFRQQILGMYNLDPTHYLTLSSLAFDCALKYSNIHLEQIASSTIVNFLERGIRGGISTIVKRYAKANHKYLQHWDPGEPSTYILYLDANNLYPSQMYTSLPVCDFRWDDEIDKWFDEFVSGKNTLGECFVDVNVHRPRHLHSYFQEYPLFAEKKNGKLICDLHPKTNYVCHSDYLRLALRLGYVLDQVNKVLVYTSQPWLKKFVEKNTEMRTKATSTSEKNLWKQMNNSVFGKTIENVRQRCHVELANDSKTFVQSTQKPTYKNFVELQEEQCLVEFHKKSVTLNKPIYDGVFIFDKSKEWMAHFFYDYLKPKFGNKCHLLMTDTDSFLLEIETQDVYNDLRHNVTTWFDTSNYVKPPCPEFLINQNKKVPGYFKDEMAGHFITEFVGLRSKQYAFSLDNGQVTKKCKGLNKQAMGNITLEHYKQELHQHQDKRVDMHLIRSHQHQVYLEKISKKTLDKNDDKRIVCGIETLPFGYNPV